jgi:hypothetical protein
MLLSGLLVLDCIGPLSAAAQSISMAPTASHKLGFSGAIVSITESNRRGPVADRTFHLQGANGKNLYLRFHKGGGTMGNSSLNLFSGKSDQFFIVSERDCVEFDPVKVTSTFCSNRPPCNNGAVVGLKYLGRFDWMNAFDSPKGRFRYAFRYLPSLDASESGSCAGQG